MVAIKIPSNPCDTNQKTLKRILRKIHKKNDTRKNYFKSTSKALELVKRQEGHSINCINKLSKSTLTHKHVIPRHVVQVWHSKTNIPDSVRESITMLKTQNPEFKHTLFDEKDCRLFIAKYYTDEVLDTYDKIIPHALKADLWRYCYLYKNGGIYLDAKYYCVNGFKLNLLTNREYFCRDVLQSFNGIYNAILVCKPKNKIMHKCIDQVVKNVRDEYYGSNGLCPTGPLMIASFFTTKQINNLKLNHELLNEHVRFIRYNDCRILQYHERYKKEQVQMNDHWSKYWREGKIYNK